MWQRSSPLPWPWQKSCTRITCSGSAGDNSDKARLFTAASRRWNSLVIFRGNTPYGEEVNSLGKTSGKTGIYTFHMVKRHGSTLKSKAWQDGHTGKPGSICLMLITVRFGTSGYPSGV
ncbi:hypothetical protein J6590_034850 [Homalodisca vitripennis]|nr:hypothetical protein J6590_034850 [Homalodisca vitripennis]